MVKKEKLRYVNKEMLVEDIIETYPETVAPLQEMGVRCIRCGEPVWGTLEENIRQKDLKHPDEIVERLNQIIRKKQKKSEH
jgi:methionine synthase II (cobalamin-independent)